VNRRTWGMVDKFLVYTPFMARRLLAAGLEQKQITLLPPYAPDPGEPTTSPGEDFLYLGRLDVAKGVNLLLDAWRSRTHRSTRRLRIAGAGPLEDQVRSMVQNYDDVDYLGHLDHNEAATEMQRCGVVVVPSLWYEGFPLVVVEALAHGRPVMTNRSTGFASALSDEFAWCIQPTVDSWRKAIDTITQADVEARGLAARKHFVDKSSPSAALTSLVEIYGNLLGRNA
jgi:glycosyltransferase involved in cell wall biosynthesis